MINYFWQQLVKEYEINIANFGCFEGFRKKKMIDKVIFLYLF